MSAVDTISAPLAISGNGNVAGDLQSFLVADTVSPAAPGITYDDDWSDNSFGNELEAPRRTYVSATWLDALGANYQSGPPEQDSALAGNRITATNSDDNGLYRMFIGVSP